MSNFNLKAVISGPKNPIHALFALQALGSLFVPLFDNVSLSTYMNLDSLKLDLIISLMLLLTALSLSTYVGVNKLIIRGLALASLILLGNWLFELRHILMESMDWNTLYMGGALLSLLGLIYLPKYKVNTAA